MKSLRDELFARYRAAAGDSDPYGLEFHIFEAERALRSLEAFVQHSSIRSQEDLEPLDSDEDALQVLEREGNLLDTVIVGDHYMNLLFNSDPEGLSEDEVKLLDEQVAAWQSLAPSSHLVFAVQEWDLMSRCSLTGLMSRCVELSVYAY